MEQHLDFKTNEMLIVFMKYMKSIIIYSQYLSSTLNMLIAQNIYFVLIVFSDSKFVDIC